MFYSLKENYATDIGLILIGNALLPSVILSTLSFLFVIALYKGWEDYHERTNE